MESFRESLKNQKKTVGKALLFINGEAPEKLPDFSGYSVIACSDGAFRYLEALGFPMEKLTFVSGDFDSNNHFKENFQSFDYGFEVIYTPDQETTDFEKALEIILQKGITEVDVYGASGGEMDHFLGNLSVALKFQQRMKICFFDRYSEYFFIPKWWKHSGIRGKMISLFPFPSAKNIITHGLNWPLFGENLAMGTRIGTRNFAVDDEVSISFESGNLLVFIGESYQ